VVRIRSCALRSGRTKSVTLHRPGGSRGAKPAQPAGYGAARAAITSVSVHRRDRQWHPEAVSAGAPPTTTPAMPPINNRRRPRLRCEEITDARADVEVGCAASDCSRPTYEDEVKLVLSDVGVLGRSVAGRHRVIFVWWVLLVGGAARPSPALRSVRAGSSRQLFIRAWCGDGRGLAHGPVAGIVGPDGSASSSHPGGQRRGVSRTNGGRSRLVRVTDHGVELAVAKAGRDGLDAGLGCRMSGQAQFGAGLAAS
jgi:hypothetical protein